LSCAPWRMAQNPLSHAQTSPARACVRASVGGVGQRTPASRAERHRRANCRSTPIYARVPPSRKHAATLSALVCARVNADGAGAATAARKVGKHPTVSLPSMLNCAPPPAMRRQLQRRQTRARALCAASCARASAAGAKAQTAASAAAKRQPVKNSSTPNFAQRQE